MICHNFVRFISIAFVHEYKLLENSNMHYTQWSDGDFQFIDIILENSDILPVT